MVHTQWDGPSLPHQPLIKKMHYRLDYSQSHGGISQGGFLYPDDSSLCHLEKNQPAQGPSALALPPPQCSPLLQYFHLPFSSHLIPVLLTSALNSQDRMRLAQCTTELSLHKGCLSVKWLLLSLCLLAQSCGTCGFGVTNNLGLIPGLGQGIPFAIVFF